MESNLRKNSARSVESLRSKSWAQFLDNDTPVSIHQQYQHQQQQFYPTTSGPLDGGNTTTQDVQAAFYGQPARRFSHGWVPTNTNNNYNANTNNMMNNFINNNAASSHNSNHSNNRLNTSYSYSDIQMAAALGSYRLGNNNNIEQCQHFRQYGYCTLKEQCPYSHPPTVLLQQQQQTNNCNAVNEISSIPALRYSNSTSTCNSNNMIDSSLSLYEPTSISPLFNVKQDLSRRPSTATTTTTIAVDSEANKFIGLQLEEFQGRLYELCKDQHGCRFLQMKLEESSANVTKIYEEIHPHFVDLMTDPFGNYLCQKLLERCDDGQRSSIVEVIAPDFLKICLSMHGTRAVQKLVEFLSTKRQVIATREKKRFKRD